MENSEAPVKGIDLLKSLDRVVIRERCGSYVNSKYVVLSADGSVVFHAKEDSGILNVLVGKSRPLEIDVYDADDKEVIKLRRPYTVGQDKMDVTISGQAAAIVRKEITFFKLVLSINDLNDQPVIRVKGPVSISSECKFELYSPDKRRVGDISKRWSGMSRGTNADRDSFAIRFPAQLDVRYKAAVIGTCFLIDFLFYDN